MNRKTRVYFLDVLRGTAVVAMIVHHSYVLFNAMTGIYIDFFYSDLFEALQFFFVSIFLLVSGICTNYSRNVAKRGTVVFAAAMLVTFVTAVLLPLIGMTGFEIYFGILHMFGLTMLLYSLLDLVLKKCNGGVVIGAALLLFVLSVVLQRQIPYANERSVFLIILGFPDTAFYSADYYPLLPYFFVFIIGAMIGRWVKSDKFPRWFYSVRFKPLEFVGRHSLLFYLVHQPIVLLVIFLLNFAFHWFLI